VVGDCAVKFHRFNSVWFGGVADTLTRLVFRLEVLLFGDGVGLLWIWTIAGYHLTFTAIANSTTDTILNLKDCHLSRCGRRFSEVTIVKGVGTW
jgi:hypothetical protein